MRLLLRVRVTTCLAFAMLLDRLDFGTQAIVVTCGDTAGKKLIVEIDDAEFEVAAVDTPQSDEVVVPMTFRALATSAGEDEIVIKFE